MILKADGYVVEVAGNADEALAKVLDFKPDAVLLDIMIPGIDGLEVLKKIRTEATFAHIQPKILITTNIAQQDKAEIAKQNGAQGYLVKADIDPHELGPILAKLLASPSSAPIWM
jgi:CheY-like chemotaxis protein